MLNGVSGNDRNSREILAGIRQILQEMREDRKRADEDRRRADARFEEICRRGDEDRKEFRRFILGVGKIGLDIRKAVNGLRKAMDGQTAILKRIERRLPPFGNGRRRGKGHSNGR
ncbi:MAG TPA: hypothetical protein VI643_04475 [Planctomycetota bacterium]|nr:hypothetical protein [Planctomycetota bacterium]